MRNKLESLGHSFCCALRGLGSCVAHERNLRIHLCATVLLVWLSRQLGVSPTELGVLLLAAGLVVVSELLNTALEVLTDFFARDYHPVARLAKDVAAGAVLASALFAVAVGVVVLWRPAALLGLWTALLSSPPRLLALGFFLGACLAFVFLPGNKKLPNEIGEKF